VLLSEELQKLRAERPDEWQMDRLIRAAVGLELEKSQLLTTAQAVIDRWDTPNWKDVEPTAKVISELREVLRLPNGPS
jgi:hypothetical protein